MTIAEQLEMKQPVLYNFLIDCFELDFDRTQRVEPVDFPEDMPGFLKWKYMMEQNRGLVTDVGD